MMPYVHITDFHVRTMDVSQLSPQEVMKVKSAQGKANQIGIH